MADANLAVPRPVGRPAAHPGPRRWPALLRDPKLMFGGGFILFLVLLAIFAPVVAPHDPLEQDLMAATLPPWGFAEADPAHLLGTDDLGRDVLSRLIFGTRVALTVAAVAALVAATAGTLLGLLAGYFGGWVDAAVSRLVEIWMAFPAVLLSILIVAVLGSGLTSVIVAIAVIDWTRFARVIRADTMAQAQADYVTAARTLGFGRWTILFREILPNVMPGLIALLALEMGIAVVVEAILSFVGLSVSSDTPTWGGMIASGRQIIYQAWWVFAAPLAAVFLTVLAFNQVGDGLRRLLDPVLRR
ncbi:ABC transporter permease [Lichenifustis flavocetrariae]|uniref:ABC transporter permease n=1 Tax=Lichenifustis flavocetrariae TaxID=2949735 RepID=A0AA42CJY4_9HYPH|nr:ABC transporter permease [Lichenifustis flavocetrariae]MCW6509994.1 ABC transporter permease [Lichenifustis flavocetrariae]